MTQPLSPATTSSPSGQLADYLAHFQWRVLQDALAQATAAHWEHRAAVLEWARPRRGDHPGQTGTTNRERALATAARNAKYRELTQLADRCRSHAALLRNTGLDTDTQTLIAQLLTTPTPGQVA